MSKKELVKPEEGDGQLTPAQNAMMSAGVSLCSACSLMYCCSVAPWRDRDTVIGLCAGLVHFIAYAVELRAYRTASSTVITPLLQLSAVWMTLLRVALTLLATSLPQPHKSPFGNQRSGGAKLAGMPAKSPDIEALYVATSAMKPSHFLSICFVFFGGFLPAARGKVSRFADPAFYRQEAVQCCIIGELLVCVYNALLHMCTFRQDDDDVSDLEAAASNADVLRFFAVSRAGAAIACLVAVGSGLFSGFSPRECIDLATKRKPVYVSISLLGECLSVAGALIMMFSYATFYEPAVINAAEGGVQQLLNLSFALSLQYFCNLGRKIEHTKTKLVSFLFVSTGLALSAM